MECSKKEAGAETAVPRTAGVERTAGHYLSTRKQRRCKCGVLGAKGREWFQDFRCDSLHPQLQAQPWLFHVSYLWLSPVSDLEQGVSWNTSPLTLNSPASGTIRINLSSSLITQHQIICYSNWKYTKITSFIFWWFQKIIVFPVIWWQCCMVFWVVSEEKSVAFNLCPIV